eukprot:16607-Heterococcus_DN1.PRE.2
MGYVCRCFVLKVYVMSQSSQLHCLITQQPDITAATVQQCDSLHHLLRHTPKASKTVLKYTRSIYDVA